MRTQGGGGSKNGQILRTSFMDGPLIKKFNIDLLQPTPNYICILKDLTCTCAHQSKGTRRKGSKKGFWA